MKILVIIPAGHNTVHETWYDSSEDIIDFVVMWYSDQDVPGNIKKNSKHVFLEKGSKWSLVKSALQKIDWKEYDYIWIPDDDLKLLNGGIFTLCKTMEKYNISLAQPSLIDKHVQWSVLLNRKTEYHLTNFVEIQAPCFSIKGFNEIIDTILHPDIKSGWGLDYVWSNIFKRNRGRIGVINNVIMEHVRYVSKKTTKDYQGGIDPFKEMQLTMSRHNVKKFIPMIIDD